jgi:hypothetical protein
MWQKACAPMPNAASDPALVAAAGALFKQYGEDAAVVATLRSAEDAAAGRLADSDYWLSLALILEAMGDRD